MVHNRIGVDPMRALVTGGDGFVGQHLVRHLQADTIDCTVFDARRGDDIRDYEQVRAAVERVEPDYVFHLAAQADVPEGALDPRRAFSVNVTGTLNLLEALRNTNCHARVHLAGSAAEYGEIDVNTLVTEEMPAFPVEPYGVSKLAATHLGLVYAQRHSMNIVVTRAYNHTGPGRPSRYVDAAFARRIVDVERGRAEAVYHGDLSAVRNFTDVRDVVRAYRLVVDTEPGVYNVCSGQNVAVRALLDMLVGNARVPVLTKLNPSLSGPARRDGFRAPSGVKLEAATGWIPSISMDQTMRDLLDWWRAQ